MHPALREAFMIKVRNASLIALLVAAIAISSCSYGLEPSWKKTEGLATFSLDLTQAFTGSRAVSSGTGYLYIRTAGGPSGAKGPTYGPYVISGPGVFATSDIPAGTYPRFAICYSAVSLEGNAEFKSLISLPDQDFLAQATGTNAMDILLDGDASGAILDNVVLQEGKVNAVSAVLIPFIHEPQVSVGTYVLPVNQMYGTMTLPDLGPSVRKKFIHVTGADFDPVYNPVIQLSISPGSTHDPITVNVFRLYDSSGRLLYARSNSLPVRTNLPLVYLFPNPGASEYYLYVEYTYDPNIDFTLIGS